MIAEFEERIFTLIEGMVAHGTDDELFASGYLQGHLTVSVADAEANGETTSEQLKARVQSSLDKAIQAGELSPRDQVLVVEMWEKLYQQALPETSR